MADHKIDGNDGAGNVDLIRRIDAMQACQVGHSDEWSKATKDGYNQAATDCAMAILRVAPAPAANDEVASYKMAAMECELECKALRAELAAAKARAEGARDAALVEAADIILADNYDDPDSAADAILALRDKPAPGVTVQEAARVLLGVFEDPDANAPHGFDWQSMYDEMTADHKESLDICGTHDWPSTLIVALRAIAASEA